MSLSLVSNLNFRLMTRRWKYWLKIQKMQKMSTFAASIPKLLGLLPH